MANTKLRHPNLLDCKKAALVIIDVQSRFVPVIDNFDSTIKAIQKLIKGAKTFNLPIVYTEQYPKGLGNTVPDLLELLRGKPMLEKLRFSAFGPELENILGKQVDQIILAGIETHVCILQTALDFKMAGYQVYIAKEAVSSRQKEDKLVALDRLSANGVTITGVESILFELAEIAGTPEFKAISALVK